MTGIVSRQAEPLPAWVVSYLWLERTISQRVAELVGLTYDGRGICIPIEGLVKRRNLVSYDAATGRADSGAEPKMLWIGGARNPEEPLPPFPSWRDLRLADVIVEGELDALCAMEHGFMAASGTAGAGTWKPEWSDAMTGRTATLLYDHDNAGRQGALKAAEALTRGGCAVRIASWPADRPEGFDVTDHFRLGGDSFQLQAIIDAAARYELPLPGRRLVVSV